MCKDLKGSSVASSALLLLVLSAFRLLSEARRTTAVSEWVAALTELEDGHSFVLLWMVGVTNYHGLIRVVRTPSSGHQWLLLIESG